MVASICEEPLKPPVPVILSRMSRVRTKKKFFEKPEKEKTTPNKGNKDKTDAKAKKAAKRPKK